LEYPEALDKKQWNIFYAGLIIDTEKAIITGMRSIGERAWL